MDCLIIYLRDGERRTQRITTRFIPNMKAVEFTVVNAELPERRDVPHAEDPVSLQGWMKRLRINILDVVPVGN